MSWIVKRYDVERAQYLQNRFSLTPAVATIISRLDFQADEQVAAFLSPKIAHLKSPFEIENLDSAVKRLIRAIQQRESIYIWGDYDADGVTSTVLLVKILNELGVYPDYCVPKRMDEGYGLSDDIAQRVVEAGNTQLFIALDCGSNSLEPITYLIDNGIDVIVIDHHQLKTDVHDEVILVNPHAEANCSTYCDLCTVGLVFKFVQGLLRQLKEMQFPLSEHIKLKYYLDLVAVGTITDLVPLTFENRILVQYGLYRMGRTQRPGLQALMELSGINYGKSLDTTDVSFRLGPRLNAGGRLGDAMISIELLLGENYAKSMKLAYELDSMNQERQEIERKIVEDAMQTIDGNPREDFYSLVLFNADWHTGVVGIVSSRLSKHYNVPVIVLGEEHGFAKGSSRSIDGVDIVAILKECEQHLDNWGGHPMAAGLTLNLDNVEAFRKCFESEVRKYMHAHAECLDCTQNQEVDAVLRPSDITPELLDEIDRLAPYGSGNSEPKFLIQDVTIQSKVIPFGQNNMKFWLTLEDQDFDLMCVSWNCGMDIPDAGRAIDISFKLRWHKWRGKGYPQATLMDWKYVN